MSEMIERVAKAIGVPESGGFICAWSLDAARAAIEAMREPTDDMVKVGYDSGGYSPDPQSIEAIWPAMIDAALGKVDA